MSHVCHYVPCGRPTPRRWLFCREHWRMVPAPLQRDVYAANKARTGSTMGYGRSRRNMVQDYIAAVGAAREAVRKELESRDELAAIEHDAVDEMGGDDFLDYEAMTGKEIGNK